MFISSKQWAETDTTKALKEHRKAQRAASKQMRTPSSLVESLKRRLRQLKPTRQPTFTMAGRGGYN